MNNNLITNYSERKVPARQLRHVQTEAEEQLWSLLRNRKLGGFKFRRQFPVGVYFADFCCVDKRLIIEVDGAQHADMLDDDANRSLGLAERGFRVIRFWNSDVLLNIENVCRQILEELRKTHTNPLPVGEGGPQKTEGAG